MDNLEQKILQKHLAKFIIDDVFNIITADDILTVKTPDIWFFKGKELNKNQISKLKAEAIGFYDSDLWKILRDELRFKAHNRLCNESKTEEDLIAGKMLLYLVSVIESRLKSMQ